MRSLQIKGILKKKLVLFYLNWCIEKTIRKTLNQSKIYPKNNYLIVTPLFTLFYFHEFLHNLGRNDFGSQYQSGLSLILPGKRVYG